jgi:hypothetical protein
MNLLTCTPHICCCQEWMILWDLTAMCTDCGDSFFLNPVNWTICEGLPTSARVRGDSFSTQLIEQFVKNCQLLPESAEIPFSSTQLIEQFVKNCQLLPESVRFLFNSVNWTICEELSTSAMEIPFSRPCWVNNLWRNCQLLAHSYDYSSFHSIVERIILYFKKMCM